MAKIAIIGAGNMGSAIIKGIGKRYKIIVSDSDPNKLRGLNIKNNIKAVKGAGIIILAIKPQNMDTVLKEIAGKVTPKQMVISIAAGITTKKIEDSLGRISVIRVMPNIPLLVGMGMIVLCCGRYTKPVHIRDAKRIFSGMGKVISVKKEQLMDAVTAISGSGPAYVYLFIESLIKSAIKLGLTKDDAETLVLKTLKGAIGLLEKTGKTPEELRRRVTSPGGTTEAALKVFQKQGFSKIIEKATNAACRRAKELSR